MCRLGMFDKNFMKNRGKEFMLDFLNQLEKSMGGHGNGIIFVDKGKITLDYKSMKLTNEDIVDMLFENGVGLPDWFLYHTRVASKGSIKDSNCHPYINEDKSFALMMNGTVSDFGTFGKYMGDITDTEVIFKMIDTFKLKLDVLTELSPRFIGYKDGKVYATNPSGFNGLEYTTEGGICIASESPKNEVWDDVKQNYVWIEGNDIEKEPERKTYNAYNYRTSYASGWWDYLEEDKNLMQLNPTKTNVKNNVINDEYVSYDDASYTKEEIREIIEVLIDENRDKSMWKLQTAIDELVGVCPIIDNKYTDIIVTENKQVIFQDENGELFEL